MIIGIDVGGTNFRIGALDNEFNIHNFSKIYVKDILKSDDALFDIECAIENYFSDIKIDAISIGIPGTLDVERKTIVQVPNIKGMDNLNAVEYLQSKFNVPVYLEKDVNMIINYDIYKNNINTNGIICAVYYGTGIGNAIMIDGNILIGKNGSAGEIGHIPVDNCDEVCGCGNIGCMEAVAGGKYLKKLCDEYYKDCHISEIFIKHSNDEKIVEFVNRMSMALATEINIINPNKIILGGGIINMNGFPISLFNEKLSEHVRKPYPLKDLDIIYTNDDEKAGVIGACIFALSKIQNSNIKKI